MFCSSRDHKWFSSTIVKWHKSFGGGTFRCLMSKWCPSAQLPCRSLHCTGKRPWQPRHVRSIQALVSASHNPLSEQGAGSQKAGQLTHDNQPCQLQLSRFFGPPPRQGLISTSHGSATGISEIVRSQWHSEEEREAKISYWTGLRCPVFLPLCGDK